MTTCPTPAPGQKPGHSLSTLHAVELLPPFRAILDRVMPGASGPEPWRRRQLAAAHQLLALAQISGRMLIQMLDLTQAFRTVFTLQTPVPCQNGGAGSLLVAPAAVLGLTYRQEAMLTPQPGYSFIEILQPRNVFHPNVAPSNQPPGNPSPGAVLTGAQLLCLGYVPAGIQLVELILMAYTALSLQTVQFSLADPAGVLNPAAALWFQANPSHIPLTRDPFLSNTAATR